ncbi:MAG: YfhO family protein [Bacteroidetes bacterium]|nr:YfhO family protein [Bacteroidota bacterium]
MKKIDFRKDIAPHLLAVVVFLIITIIFFNPIFFDNKTLDQHDIQQFKGSSKSIADYREATGEEALWAPSMFSGMPAYLVSVRWSDGPVVWVKGMMSVFLPHPINNIFLAFLCYYILLLTFRVRPYLAIAGAIAFGLSSYMIIGLGAGHNARIGAIAFMPLVMAGIHLAFSGKRLLGFATTALALALHLRENHLQITYYLVLIVVGYGLVQLVWAYREKQIRVFFTNVVILIPAVILAAGTFFGQFWAITEYTKYSIRGPSELSKPGSPAGTDGLSKSRAFEYNDQISEPMTLLIPDFYGGSTSRFFVEDQNSESYKALVNSGDNQLANQLANYTSSYWGESGAPYYAGAIIVFLFVIGILMVDKKWLWWVLPLSVLSIMLSWGASFSSFNYFMFDYFPVYNKFRSVTFTLIIILFLMPLLGMIGLEKLLNNGLTKETRKQLLIAFGVTGGLCLLILLFAGMGSFARDGEQQLPVWFAKALQADRRGLMRADAFRSLGFIIPIFIILYFDLRKKISEIGFYVLLIFLVAMDLSFVDKRSFTKEKFQRKHANTFFSETGADAAILTDKSYYRVYNLESPWNEARTSYYHHSLGGYHGAKLRRYQDLYDSCLIRETKRMVNNLQKGNTGFENYGVLNMLNAKYILYGPDAANVITNPLANGNAWFVNEVLKVSSANEELKKTGEVNTKNVAVVDDSKFQIPHSKFDSTAQIKIAEFTPKYLKYESQSSADGLAVFSEIYYPKGWHAFIDGKEVKIMRADYVLRALSIPAGKHVVEFKFEPKPYVIGNKVTLASNWAVLLIVLGCFGWSLRIDPKS